MSNTPTAQWGDFTFHVYSFDTDWSEVGGLYVFAGRVKTPLGLFRWQALYLGQTQDFAGYLPTHRKWLEAVQLGATHVHAMRMDDPDLRDAAEEELIQVYKPPLNVQLK